MAAEGPRAAPTTWRAALGVAGTAVLLSRLPFLGAGYGDDPDASRVVLAARELAGTGRYVVSRPPGFPVHEGTVALVVEGGPWVTNAVSAAASVAAFVFVALLLRRWGVGPWLLLALGFASVPVVFLASTTTMDYALGLAFAAAAVWAADTGRPILAGALCGLAGGARITWLGLLPFLMAWRAGPAGGWRGRAVRVAAAAGVVAGLVYAPVLGRYGMGGLTFADNLSYPHPAAVLLRMGPGVWGTVGTLGVGVAIVWAVAARARPGGRHPVLPRPGRRVSLCLGAAAFYLVVFLRLPHAAGYLVPVVLFGVLALGVLLPPAGARTLAVALLAAPWVTVGRGGVGAGPVLESHAARVAATADVARWANTVRSLPAGSAVVAGYRLPELRVALGAEPSVELLYLVESQEACDRLAAAGPVWILPGQAAFNRTVHGIDPATCGGRPLDGVAA